MRFNSLSSQTLVSLRRNRLLSVKITVTPAATYTEFAIRQNGRETDLTPKQAEALLKELEPDRTHPAVEFVIKSLSDFLLQAAIAR